MIKTVLFDFDGTVFDTGEGITKSVQYALQRLGIEEPIKNLYKFCGPPLVSMFKETYGFDDETADRAVDYFRERYSDVGWKECKPYPTIREVIKKIRLHGKTIMIATSKPTYYAMEILRYFQMQDLFDHVVGAELNGDRTTKIEVINEAIRISSGHYSEMIMIGDRKYDVYGAHHFGIPCIGVNYGYAEDSELEEARCDYIVDSPNDFFQFVL